jgi:hypothetical protein
MTRPWIIALVPLLLGAGPPLVKSAAPAPDLDALFNRAYGWIHPGLQADLPLVGLNSTRVFGVRRVERMETKGFFVSRYVGTVVVAGLCVLVAPDGRERLR